MTKHEMNELAEISSDGFGTSSTKESGISTWITEKQLQFSETKIQETVNGNHYYNRAYSSAFSGSGCDNECVMIWPLVPMPLWRYCTITFSIILGAIEPLLHVLKSGNGAKENSSATLFSLSVLEECKTRIGRSGAVKALARIVQAGTVKYLVDLMDPESGMVDKAIALLSNLSTISEAGLVIVRERGIPILVEVVESGSCRGKENTAFTLLQLCLNSSKFWHNNFSVTSAIKEKVPRGRARHDNCVLDSRLKIRLFLSSQIE
ncbi:hypothetical protein F3Y22_tig00110332pilonHSYRG01405 [Hibiscus syriacus]|uniref:Uncharacterized protein n=1 Tax=Hibiscus syriacus TaxID=106335 RepID=A0A6A3AY53_HIBSY|nr:hypothetical protein F3Y22_tig00110332pilonHSYRG01405 [Hibiscus syriacus]